MPQLIIPCRLCWLVCRMSIDLMLLLVHVRWTASLPCVPPFLKHFWANWSPEESLTAQENDLLVSAPRGPLRMELILLRWVCPQYVMLACKELMDDGVNCHTQCGGAWLLNSLCENGILNEPINQMCWKTQTMALCWNECVTDIGFIKWIWFMFKLEWKVPAVLEMEKI